MLALSLVVGLILQQPALTQTKTELRGVWLTNIDSDVLFGRDRLTNALKTLKQLTLIQFILRYGIGGIHCIQVL